MVDQCDGLRIELVSHPDSTNGWNGNICDEPVARDRVFQLVASLANILDKPMVIETMKSMLGIEPIEVDDCILFDDLAVKFGEDGRVIGLYQTFDGSMEPAKSIIQNLSRSDHTT